MRVDAVISVFNPDVDLQAHVDLVRAQTSHVVVVDDGSTTPPSIREADGVRVVTLPVNSGVAAALNAGIVACLEDGADAVLTLDQDSTLPDGAVAELVSTLLRLKGRAAFVAPEFFGDVSQVIERGPGETLRTRRTIQSGMVVPRETFDRVGLLREELFIDLVDIDFELRCHAAGLEGYAAPGLRIGHRLGHRYERGPLGRFRLPGLGSDVTLSTPFRYYYRVRNRVAICRLPWKGRVGWMLRDAVLDAAHFVDVLVASRPRRVMWRIMRAGWRDGRRGTLGPAPEWVLREAATVTWRRPEVSP